MNFLRKNWTSVTIVITFSVLVVSLAIHSYYQPLEYDEYRTRSMALDAEFDRLIWESTPLYQEIRDTAIVEKLMSMSPEEAAAWQKEAKKRLAKSKGLRKKKERLQRKKPVSPTFAPHH